MRLRKWASATVLIAAEIVPQCPWEVLCKLLSASRKRCLIELYGALTKPSAGADWVWDKESFHIATAAVESKA
jgi:hypothetical protein